MEREGEIQRDKQEAERKTDIKADTHTYNKKTQQQEAKKPIE